MSDIKYTDLMLLRKYLLEQNVKTKHSLHKAIPGFLLKYFLTIEHDFQAGVPAEHIAKNINAIELTPTIQQLQFDYLNSLALSYLNGERNEAVQKVVQLKNPLFQKILSQQENLAFDSDLTQAFIFKERYRLKRMIKTWESDTAGSEDFEQGFLLLERERLKEQLQQEEKAYSEVPMAAVHKAENAHSLKQFTGTRILWKPIAIAASIMGVALTGAVFFLQSNTHNKYEQSAAFSTPDDVKRAKNIDLEKTSIAYEPLKAKTEVLKVIKETAFAFGEKDELIKLNKYNIPNGRVDLLNTAKGIKENFYTFTKKNISEVNLYTKSKSKFSIVKLGKAYYLANKEEVYLLVPTKTSLPLRKMPMDELWKRVQQVKFQNQ